jgi:hypothetical protein
MPSLTTHADMNRSAHDTHSTSKAELIAGRIMTGLVVAFLLFDSVCKLLKLPFVIEGTIKLGYPEHVIVGLGVVLLISTLAYLVPATSLLGAILLTGYLGGAVATHVRVDDALFSHVLFPVYVGALLWGGLFLRDARIRELLPLRRRGHA